MMNADKNHGTLLYDGIMTSGHTCAVMSHDYVLFETFRAYTFSTKEVRTYIHCNRMHPVAMEVTSGDCIPL